MHNIMTKRYWIAAAFGLALMNYWLFDEIANASQSIVKQTHSQLAMQNTAASERHSVIEVKQTLTTEILERANSLAFEKALDMTSLENSDLTQDELETLESNGSLQLTQTNVDNNPYQNAAENRKPNINLAVAQQLQTIIYGWELTQSNPVNYSLSLEQLFEDPEGDLLTTRIWLENANGLSVRNQGQIILQGAPQATDQTN